MKRRIFTRRRRRRSAKRAAVAIILGLALIFAFLPREAYPAAQPPLFGTSEVRGKSLKPFPKWTGMLDRWFKERDVPEGDCGSPKFNRCHLAAWKEFLGKIKDKSRYHQLELVHLRMNSAPYVTDLRNYGVNDYWATPKQFVYRDGDCEDYAIAKYMSLRALGYSPDEMRVVVLQDNNLRVAHAILVVFQDGKGLVLDNQLKSIIDQKRIRHYSPFYSVNETTWWLHKKR